MKLKDFTEALENKYLNSNHSYNITSRVLNESIKESCRLTESAKRVAQISFDIMYDPESDEPNSQPDDIAYGFEWELDNTGYCKVLGSNIEDITDVYKDQYSNDFPELDESLNEGVVTDRVKRFIDTVEKFQDDMTFTDTKNDHELELTNKEIEMLDSLRSSLSRYSKLKESCELKESRRLNEDSLELERCPNKVRTFIGEHDQAWQDCCNYFHVDPEDEDALDNIDIYDILDWVYEHDQLYRDLYNHVYPSDEQIEKFFADNDIPYNERGYFSINDIIEESLNESSMPPIRKVLQDNKIMDTLDKDPQGTINKALQVVRDSDEISAKDKNTFANAVGKGPINKRISSLASYFYDVNRVGRKR